MFKLQRLEITGFKSFADYTEILFTGEGITAVVGPNGCGKCVSGDTLITLSNGKEVEIKELTETALANSFVKEKFDDGFLTRENPQDIEIISLNPQTLKLEPRKVNAFIKRESTPKLLQIRTKAGREIKATPYHPLFTIENGKLRTLKADEVKIGVKIAVPRILKTNQKEVQLTKNTYLNSFASEDNIFVPYSDDLQNWSKIGRSRFGSLSNLLSIAETNGNTKNNFRNKQSINISDLQKISDVFDFELPFTHQIKSSQSGFLNLPKSFSADVARFLGLLIAEGRNTYSSQVWFVNADSKVNKDFASLAKRVFDVETVQKNYKKGSTDSLIFSQSLCKTLEKVFNFPINSNSFHKEVPAQLFESESKTKWAFLSGLFEGDAHICSRRQKSNGKHLTYIEYATASEKLAKQVISLLLQLGITAYLRPKQKYASNTADKKVRQYYSVYIYGSQQLKFVAENLEFVGEKQIKLNELKKLDVSENPNRDLVPTANEIIREAVKLAKVKIKPNRKQFPKLSAYTSKVCEPSRKGLREIIETIKFLSEDTSPAETTLQKLSKLAHSDIFWDEVVQVKEIEPTEKYVYDLSIDETHNFVAGNIIVHNSNVSDCISWVLGEQRAKSLRGEEMKDVIFQGTNKRKPSGMAEVVLHLVRDEIVFNDEDDLSDIDESLAELDQHTIDAAEFEESEAVIVEHTDVTAAIAPAKIKTKRHWRPRNRAFDFAVGEAVSVTRRLYLSGESEYLLNGKSCRLRDIHDLFSGTGLSGSNYAIIEQGKIGQILSSKPSDRRTLIEEAAGISKFRTRQRAAESRLESAKGNLRRISDIVSEVEKQENALRRQAAKTRRYKVLREEFRELLRQMFLAEGNRLSDLVDELEAKLSGATDEERKLSADVLQKDEAFRKATKSAREAEENLSELRAIHAENALKRDRVQREIVYQNEQTENLTKRSEVLKFDISSNEQRLKLISDEAIRLRKEDSEHSQVVQKEEFDLREAEQKHQTKQREVREIETNLEKIRSEVLQHTTATERFAGIKRQLENNFERSSERLEGLRRESTRADQTHTEHLAEVLQIQQDIATSKKELEKIQAEKHKIFDAANEIRQTLQTAEKELKTNRDEFSRTKHRLETLRELEEKKAIYAPSVQKLFAAEKQIGVKFSGTLADKLSVDAKVEKAVEAIFGNNLQAVLVENSADGFKVSKWLSENNVGRITVISEQGKGRKFKINGESLIAYLGVSSSFVEVLVDLFPREMLSKVVEKLEDIPANSTEDFVTFNGDLYLGGMLFTSGKQISGDKNSSLLAFKRELRELEITNKNLAESVEKSEKEVAKIREKLTEKETQTSDLQRVISAQEREIYSKEVQAKSLAQETERAERHKRVVAEETKQIEREISELKIKQSDAQEKSQKAENARVIAATQLSEISEKLNISRQNSEHESAVLSEKRAASATSIERRRSVSASLRRVESEQRELENRLANQNLEIIEVEAKLSELTQAIKELTAKHESVEEEKNNESNELVKATEHLTKSRKQADEFSAELTELNKLSGSARNKRAEIEVGQAEAVTRLQNLNESCSHELNLSLIELLETVEANAEFDLQTGKQQVDDLREKLDNFGAINMLALEELSETEERLLFLTSQRRDIVDSIGLAEEALREIKERSRERFREAFEAINKHFSVFFQELFGGGRGEMSLLEAEDILEAGIEIVAQPPGKRLQNLLLLSGGEKAMTAIALVMAIFQYRPSPFCLLDEVDAPLDEANVGRFVAKIEQMSVNTQFIVITHNKRTMEAAKALYGVTMQEAGVSKVVSVRFE